MVKRYDVQYDRKMTDNKLGNYVLYTDYAKLEAEHKEAVKELVFMLKTLEWGGPCERNDPTCPICFTRKGYEHDEICSLKELITKWQG